MQQKKVTSKAAQVTIVGLIILGVTAIVWSVFIPVLNAFLDPAAGNATARGETELALLIGLIPFLGWVVIIIAFFLLVAPFRQA